MHWNKEQYVTHLKNMGISVKSTWRLDIIRQLYFVNQKYIENSTQSGPVLSPEPNNSNIYEVPVAPDEQPSVETDQHTNENRTISRTGEMLKDSTSALKSANEAISAMSSMVVGLLANKEVSISSSNSPSNQKSNLDFASAYQATYGNNTPISSANAEQTFQRQADTSKGIVFAGDLPKLDYVSTSLHKQILEEHNIAINWGKVDDRLLHLVMNGLQSRECELCGDYDHTTKFYQKNVYQETPSCAPQNTTNGRVVDKSKDRHGRNIVQAECHDICNNFNYGTCKWKDCKFTHACLKCKRRGHGFKTCVNNNKDTSNQNKTADKPKVKTSR
ncbi:unnamed protein product [Mytilus coruscus]|uniref:C3H1-type domain-containing protein n=1 Tax=Mytilus coruscus TaxID=42192 RepID=A0A6J8E6B2_MYTCO|nr:unnamed protein product [Mytilus coruscus]